MKTIITQNMKLNEKLSKLNTLKAAEEFML
jgi:hypothetical protein